MIRTTFLQLYIEPFLLRTFDLFTVFITELDCLTVHEFLPTDATARTQTVARIYSLMIRKYLESLLHLRHTSKLGLYVVTIQI